jgi:hypothetical protein
MLGNARCDIWCQVNNHAEGKIQYIYLGIIFHSLSLEKAGTRL